MTIPLQITFHGTDLSDAVQAVARAKLHLLEPSCPHVDACQVTVEEKPVRNPLLGRYGVRVVLQLPGRPLLVERVEHRNMREALLAAFERLGRQLGHGSRSAPDETAAGARTLHGEVAQIDRMGGFGFIRTPDSGDYYFSRFCMAQLPFEELRVGTAVWFVAEHPPFGPQARRVALERRHGPEAGRLPRRMPAG